MAFVCGLHWQRWKYPTLSCLYFAIGVVRKSSQGSGERSKRSFISRDTKPFCNLWKYGRGFSKEEVWEVAAELIGLSLGILALDTPSISSSYPMLTWTWLGTRFLHLWFRYLSLSVLRFNTINLKRARILVNSHISYQKLPGINDCNRMENLLVWERFLKPKITFGVCLEEMVIGNKRGSMEGATSVSVLRSVWQSYWIHQNQRSSDDVSMQLELSLIALTENFDDVRGLSENIMELSLQRDLEVTCLLVDVKYGSRMNCLPNNMDHGVRYNDARYS